jgi:hypothetical protein
MMELFHLLALQTYVILISSWELRINFEAAAIDSTIKDYDHDNVPMNWSCHAEGSFIHFQYVCSRCSKAYLANLYLHSFKSLLVSVSLNAPRYSTSKIMFILLPNIRTLFGVVCPPRCTCNHHHSMWGHHMKSHPFPLCSSTYITKPNESTLFQIIITKRSQLS